MKYLTSIMLVFVCSLVLFAFDFSKPVISDYDYLKLIPSPKKLLADSRFPRCYSAQVTISGSVGNEIAASITAMNLPVPKFREELREDGSINLSISNEDYPIATRDLVSGIVNPGQMIDYLLSSLLRYRTTDELKQLQTETVLKKNVSVLYNRPVFDLFLSPSGNRFAYRYEDLGAYVRESWLTHARITMDTATYLVYEIAGLKHSRTFRIDATSKPPVDSAQMRYRIVYDSVSNRIPVSLSVFENKEEKLSVVVTYRQEKNATVFNSRTISYALPMGKTGILAITYGKYNFSLFSPKEPEKPVASSFMKKLESAATLSRKASRLLESGDVSAASRVLRRLVDEYPQTPQGIEATKLLSNVPN